MRNARSRIVVIAAALSLLPACGSAFDSGGGGEAMVVNNLEAEGAAPQLASQANRSVIYTAEVLVRVSSATKATAAAIDATADAGGFLFAQEADAEQGESVLTVKVPSDKFDQLLARLTGLGKTLQRSVRAQDVTDEVIDLEGRLKTNTASAERLRSLLGQANDTAAVVTIEAELAKREAEIESQQGRLRVLNDQVTLATITVRFTEREDLQVADDLPGFLGGLRAGLVAVANIGLGILVIVGFLLPFLPFVAAAFWIVRRYRRRRRMVSRQASPPGGPSMPPPQPPPAVPPPAPGNPAGAKSEAVVR